MTGITEHLEQSIHFDPEGSLFAACSDNEDAMHEAEPD